MITGQHFVGSLIKIKESLGDIVSMGMEIFLAIATITALTFGVGIHNFVKSERLKQQQRRENREKVLIDKERVARERREIEFFAKHPEVYKIVKTISADGTTVNLNIEDEYKSIFIEYLHRFKDFARIKGFTTDIKIQGDERGKKLSCRFDLKPIKRGENRTSPEELFRNYLVSYPIFI